MPKSQVTYPTVCLNGTQPQELMDGYLNALEALRTAREALCKVAPNGRDYGQLWNGGASDEFLASSREHRIRVDQIQGIIRELELISEHVCQFVE